MSPSFQPARKTAGQTKIELKGGTSVNEEGKKRRKRATEEDVSRSEGKKGRIIRETLLNYMAVAFERPVAPTPELLFPLCPEHLWLPPTCHLPCNDLSSAISSSSKPAGEIRASHANELRREAALLA